MKYRSNFTLAIMLIATALCIVPTTRLPASDITAVHAQEVPQSWQLRDGVCVFGDTLTPPAPCDQKAPLGTNWKGAAFAR
ncbi:MAG TPA: hypothetical protein VIU65_00200 [Pyrinomonadaceae bacterium]